MATVFWNAENLLLVDSECSSLLKHARQTEGSCSMKETVTARHCWSLFEQPVFPHVKLCFLAICHQYQNHNQTASPGTVLKNDRILTQNIIDTEVYHD
jgi:hypothetical protein